MLPLPLPRGGEGKGRGGERRAAPRGAPHNLASSGSLPEEEEEGEEEEEEEGKEGEGRGGKIKKKKKKTRESRSDAAGRRQCAERSRGEEPGLPAPQPEQRPRRRLPELGPLARLPPGAGAERGAPPWVVSAPLGVISTPGCYQPDPPGARLPAEEAPEAPPGPAVLREPLETPRCEHRERLFFPLLLPLFTLF